MDLVFCREDGTPMDGVQILRYGFSRILEAAGLPDIRFPDLRHTAATILFLRGIHPKVVSEMLGHSTISVTLDLYSHVLPNMQRDATKAMDDFLQSS
jgi:integrase